MPSPLAKCRTRGMSLRAAVLLERIRWWHTRATITRDGVLWVVKPRAEWCAESGLSLDQYKAALTELRRAGLVRVERHLFKNRVTAFIAPTAAASSTNPSGADDTNPLVEDATIRLVWDATNQLEADDTKHIQGKTTGEITGEVCASLSLAKMTPAPGEDEAGKDDTKEGAMKVADLVLAAKAKTDHAAQTLRKLEPKDGKAGVKALLLAWNKACGAAGAFGNAQLTGKNLTALKAVRQTCPEGAEALLVYAARHWASYRSSIEAEFGGFNVAQHPNLHDIGRFVEGAVQWWQRRVKEDQAWEAKKQAASAAVTPAPTPTTPQAPKPAPAPLKPVSLTDEERFARLLHVNDGDLARTKAEWLEGHATLPAAWQDPADKEAAA